MEKIDGPIEHAEGAAVCNLGAADAAAREHAFAALRDQGRYAEPILRRVLRRSGDERVKSLCRQLLATDFNEISMPHVSVFWQSQSSSAPDPLQGYVVSQSLPTSA